MFVNAFSEHVLLTVQAAVDNVNNRGPNGKLVYFNQMYSKPIQKTKYQVVYLSYSRINIT